MTTRRRHRAITLLELLLVMLLIATAFGVGIPITRSLAHERVHKNIGSLAAHLQLVQTISLHYHTDVQCLLEQAEGGLVVSCLAYGTVPERILQPKRYSAIESFCFEGRPQQSLSLWFGSSCPKGELTLCGKGGEGALYFSGFPSSIAKHKRRSYDVLPAPYPQTALLAA